MAYQLVWEIWRWLAKQSGKYGDGLPSGLGNMKMVYLTVWEIWRWFASSFGNIKMVYLTVWEI